MIKLLSIVALAIAAATSAHAQNNKPVRTGNYYEDRASADIATGSLNLAFAQTPTDKFVNITRVSCIIITNSAQTLAQVIFFLGTSSGGTDIGRDTAVDVISHPGAISNGLRYLTISAPLYLKVGPGRYPTLSIYAPGSSPLYTNANCSFIGDLSDN